MTSAAPKATGPKTYWRGTHRSVSPAATVARVKPYLRAMGITRIANVTGMDVVGIDTFIVSRPNARSLSVSQGKGIDADAARASALMESIEQHCAERIARPLRLARLPELAASAAVVDVSRLPRFVTPFGEQSRILWIEATRLGTTEGVWVPYELVHLDLTLPLPPGSGHFLPSSSGLASGNDTDEAVAHGLTEVIERDALTLFYDLPPEAQWQRRVDLASVDEPVCLELLARYRRADVAVAVWDLTSDVGVPAFLCSVLDRAPDPFRPIGLARGSGCHPDRAVALARALCEAAQSRLTRIAGSRDDIQAKDHAAQAASARIEEARQQFLTPAPCPRLFTDVTTRLAATSADDVAWLAERLRAAGLGEILTVDLSLPDCPCSVVRVLVPGLEPSCEIPHYVPGARALARRQSS